MAVLPEFFAVASDEFITIMVMPYQWLQMTKAKTMPELAEDIRFRDPRSRRDNNKALQAIIETGCHNLKAASKQWLH
jgi:crotonobetainyl-CoA:carnitine CoA-transferase CaiB-like acyl-CoA transferase